MQWLVTLISILQILSALAMIGLVLVQHGKGADMGASFGGGSSGSLFGAAGSANFLSRSTAVCATAFFVCTLGLALLGNQRSSNVGSGSVLDRAAQMAPAASAAPASAAPAAASTAPAASGAALIPTK